MSAPLAFALFAVISVTAAAVPAAFVEVVAMVCLNKFPSLSRGSVLSIVSFVSPFPHILDPASFASPPPLQIHLAPPTTYQVAGAKVSSSPLDLIPLLQNLEKVIAARWLFCLPCLLLCADGCSDSHVSLWGLATEVVKRVGVLPRI